MKKLHAFLLVGATNIILLGGLWAAGLLHFAPKTDKEGSPDSTKQPDKQAEQKKPQELIVGKWERQAEGLFAGGKEFTANGAVTDYDWQGPKQKTYKFVNDTSIEYEWPDGKENKKETCQIQVGKEWLVETYGEQGISFVLRYKRVQEFPADFAKSGQKTNNKDASAPKEASAPKVATVQAVLTFKKHEASVESVAISPDGMLIASGGGDGVVLIWERATGKVKHKLGKQQGDKEPSSREGVQSVAFSPDGSTIAAGWSQDVWDRPEWVVLWNVATGERRRGQFDGSHVAFSSDGKTLVTATRGQVHVWDLLEDKKVFSKGSSSFLSIAISPDGKLIASGEHDGYFKVWDAKSGEKTFGYKYSGPTSGTVTPLYSVAFHPESTLVAVDANQRSDLFDLKTGDKVSLKGKLREFSHPVFLPDGKHIACNHRDDRSVRILDWKSGEERLILKGHTDPIKAVVASSDGKWLVSASQDHTVKVWDLSSVVGSPLKVAAPSVEKDVFTKRDTLFRKRHPIKFTLPKAPLLFEGRSGEVVIGITKGPAFPGSLMIKLEPSIPNKLVKIDRNTFEIKAGDDKPTEAVFRLSLDASSGDSTLSFRVTTEPSSESLEFGIRFQFGDFDKVDPITIKKNPSNFEAWQSRSALVFDGEKLLYHLVLYGKTGKMFKKDMKGKEQDEWGLMILTTGRAERSIEVGNLGYSPGLAISPDGTFMAVSTISWVKVWNMATGTLERHYLIDYNESGWLVEKTVAFSSDGKHLLSLSRKLNPEMKMVFFLNKWDLSTEKERQSAKIDGTFDSYGGVAISRDGKRMAGGESGRVVVWNVAQNKAEHNFTSGVQANLLVLPRTLAFSPDGRWLSWVATYSDDKEDKSDVKKDKTESQLHELFLCDLVTGKQRSLQKSKGDFSAAAFSPEGDRLAVRSYDSGLRLWNTVSGQEVNFGPGKSLYNPTFSPDGKYLAATNVDTITVWQRQGGATTKANKVPNVIGNKEDKKNVEEKKEDKKPIEDKKKDEEKKPLDHKKEEDKKPFDDKKNIENKKDEIEPLALLSLKLSNSQVTNAKLRELATYKNLMTLDLSFTSTTDTGLKELASLKNLTTLDLSFTSTTDTGLKELASIKNLTTLDLTLTKVTDAGMKELTALKNLTSLYLAGTKVTDAGLKELANLKNLTSLELAGTKVTDAGLKELANLKNLSYLSLGGTQVTEAGVAELRKALPNAKIQK